MPTELDGVRRLYAWVRENSPTLQTWEREGNPLSPRLELRAYANGLGYDVQVSFFVEQAHFVPIGVIPHAHAEVVASLVASDTRTRGFATVGPVRPGSGVLAFRHCVWDREVWGGVQ